MKLHQQALQPPTGHPGGNTTLSSEANLLGNHKHWLAPEEAKASGFMDILDEAPARSPAGGADQACTPMLDSVVPLASQAKPVSIAADLSQLTAGAWLEISVQGVWQRSQLSWISPQSSLYLFTNVHGSTQSMTRRMLEKLLAANALRVVSEQSMVDGALDAVVHAAMLNSLDIRL